jgi:hypothetical protein
MALNHHEFLQLCRIEESLRRSDPGLARTLSAPIRRRCSSLWALLSYVTLAVCALLALTGLVASDTTVTIAGALALLTIYPFLLIMRKRRRSHLSSS